MIDEFASRQSEYLVEIVEKGSRGPPAVREKRAWWEQRRDKGAEVVRAGTGRDRRQASRWC
jgi:hypothetical protein